MTLANAPLLFWMVSAVLCAIAVAAAIWPYLRGRPISDEDEVSLGVRQVLIDQLDEIERDRERGLLNIEEAETNRAEVARRLITVDKEIAERTLPEPRKEIGIYKIAAIVLIPVITLGVYAVTGEPGRPDMPHAARMEAPAEGETIVTLVGRVEAHLAQNPDDERGWRTIAPIYQRLGRLDDAENAFRRAISLNPPTEEDLGTLQNGLGQVLSQKAGGRITDEALSLFREGMANSPDDPTGFFFEALALSQQGVETEAIDAWEKLIARYKAEEPSWLPAAEEALATLQEGLPAGSTRPPAPELPVSERAPPIPEEAVRAMQDLSPEEQLETINNMVAGLAARLEDEPDNLAGWVRLINAYIVLDQSDKAKDALKSARDQFTGNTEAGAILDSMARESGLLE